MSENLTKITDGNLANRISYLLTDSYKVADMWGFYLCDAEMDREPELRNKITAIWIRSLIDSIEGEQRYLSKYRDEANKRGFANMCLICDRLREYFECVRGTLSRFTKEEQVFLYHVRNMLVHGWVIADHRETINIKYFDGEKVAVEVFERDEYWDLKKEFYRQVEQNNADEKNLDEILAPLRERLKSESLYWGVLAKLQSTDFMNLMSKGIKEDLGILDKDH